MPQNTIPELFRHFDLKGPRIESQADSPRFPRDSHDRDFAGLLAENLSSGPEPEPKRRAESVRSPAEDRASRSQRTREQDTSPKLDSTERTETRLLEEKQTVERAAPENSAESNARPSAGGESQSANLGSQNESARNSDASAAPADEKTPTGTNSATTTSETVSGFGPRFGSGGLIFTQPALIPPGSAQSGQNADTSTVANRGASLEVLRSLQTGQTAPTEQPDDPKPVAVSDARDVVMNKEAPQSLDFLRAGRPGTAVTPAVDTQSSAEGKSSRNGPESNAPQQESGLDAAPRSETLRPPQAEGPRIETQRAGEILNGSGASRVAHADLKREASTNQQPQDQSSQQNRSAPAQTTGSATANVAKALPAETGAHARVEFAQTAAEGGARANVNNSVPEIASANQNVNPVLAIGDTGGSKPSALAQATGTDLKPSGIDGDGNKQESSPVEQVVRAARAQIGARQSQVRLQLNPPELGQVRINVRINGNTINMHVESQTNVTHQLLQSRVSELRHALESQGLTVDRVQFDVKAPSPASSSQHHQGESGSDYLTRDTNPEAHSGRQGHAQADSESEHKQPEPGPDTWPAQDEFQTAEPDSVSASNVNVMA